MPKYLITGGAGFIGSHLVDRLSLTEAELVVIDNFDAYYSRDEKLANINPHVLSGRAALLEADILDNSAFDSICLEGFDAIVHLAALAGVRPSIARPLAYKQVNVVGTTRLLELAKQWSIPRFIFASSSSVYGNHPAVPETESLQDLPADQPLCGEQTVRRTHRPNLLSSLRYNICRLAPFHRLWAKAAARPGGSQV